MDEEFHVVTLGDLMKLPVSVGEARAILKIMGAEFEALPKVELGNLLVGNIHADYYICHEPRIVQKIDGGIKASMSRGFDPEWKVDEKLLVNSMTAKESLLRYAKLIQDEYADLDDKKLLSYACIGRKRYDRARDECLRRGLTKKVGE